MKVRSYARSFAGGEISPQLVGRLDLAKFQTGLQKALNFWILPHGPAQNRPGFEYVNETKDSTKQSYLIDFSYNAQQTYVLELGDSYIRIHTQGATLLNTATNITGITQANPAVVTDVAHGYTSGQWVFLTGIGGMTQLNGRFCKITVLTANTFSLQGLDGTNINSTAYGAYTAGGTAATPVEVASPYVEADLFDIHYSQNADTLALVHPNYAPRQVTRSGPTTWALNVIAFAPAIATPAAPAVAPIGGAPGGGSPISWTYVTTAVLPGNLEESLGSPGTSLTIDLTITGNWSGVTPAAVTGALRYNIYRGRYGVFGYIGSSDGSTFIDNNIAPDYTTTPPTADSLFAATGDYPGAVGYYGGRRWFAGTNNNPQGLWGTRSGTESNMCYSIPTRADDRIALRILSGQVDRARHITPINDMLMLTSGGEWRIAADNSDVLTPTSASPKLQSAWGACDVKPVVVGNAVLYVDDSAVRVREVKYRWDQGISGAYSSEDISLMAQHLFDDYTIVDMAHVRKPYKFIHVVRSDGALLGLTYLPVQQVLAWHQHTTNGFFESIAGVKEGTEWPLYAVIRRTVNGRSVRYIERQHTRQVATPADAFFVDAGLTYSGASATTISGLWHLEGATVSVLADGAVAPQAVVTNGAITLANAASKVQVGLGYNSDLQTLPLAFEQAQAFAQGTKRDVNEVYLRVWESSGIFAGQTFDKLREMKQRTSEPYGSPPALKTDELGPLVLDANWAQNGAVCVRQSDPLPLTILSMTLGAAVGG